MGGEIELNRELRGLKNDQHMTHMAVESQKNKIANELYGDMGKDMNEVLNGEKFVVLDNKLKIKGWVKRFFRMF